MKLILVITLILGITERWVSAETDVRRTVIFIEKHVSYGQSVFVRGGIDHNEREGCTSDANTSACAIPIEHRIGGTNAKFNAWKAGDDFLDWYGAESDQGSSGDVAASGTPMVWTTNDTSHAATVSADGYGYTELNTWGEHYWMVDVDMDCDKTEDGWFELKGLGPGAAWESSINQVDSCGGTEGGSKPYSSGNHFAKCGSINMFTFNSDACLINSLE